MRVCHLVRQYHPSIGGLENFVAALCAAQIAQGAECEVVTLDRVFERKEPRLPRDDVVEGIRVRRVPMFGARRYFIPSLRKTSLRDFDVLHVHGIDGFFEAVARLPRRAGQTYIATTHGGIFHTKWLAPIKRVYFDRVSRALARSYDALIANSASDRDLFAGADVGVELIPNGVRPLGDFQVSGGDILTIGRLAKHKRVERLIEAMAQPALRSKAVRLHVIGPDWDVKAQDLAQYAATLGISDRIILHGHVSDAKCKEIARSCGVFVSASEYEGFGMTLIEAMSVGLLPVVEANNSFTELIGEAGIGALVHFQDASGTSSAIEAALQNTNREQRNKAQNFAARFSWDAHARQTFALYGEAAARRQRAA